MIQFLLVNFVWWILFLTFWMHPQLGTMVSRVCPWGCSVSFHHLGENQQVLGWKPSKYNFVGFWWILPRKPLLKKHHNLVKIGFLVNFFAFSCPKKLLLKSRVSTWRYGSIHGAGGHQVTSTLSVCSPTNSRYAWKKKLDSRHIRGDTNLGYLSEGYPAFSNLIREKTSPDVQA